MQDRVRADGKRERLFRDGRRLVIFVNGIVREEYPSGLSVVRFTSGDIKKAYKSGAPLLPASLPHSVVKQASCMLSCPPRSSLHLKLA